jgi:alkylation response protein AidB-like acyl-CoA dehydrogenase
MPALLSFPTDTAEKRRVLMDAVENVRATLEAGAAESEETATLSQMSVAALYDSGLLRLKLPHVLGGAEADPITQLDVLEEVSRIDPAAGWCLMIGAASLGGSAAFLPDDAIDELFEGGKPPRTAGAFAPHGKAMPVAGGYRVTGRWPFGSGVRHADWVSAGARVVGDDPRPAQLRLLMPRRDVTVHDNWQVMGLRGTGSCDFSVDDLFVPDRFAWDVSRTEPTRGGPLYRLGRPGFVTNEHSAFALGVGRRALDAFAEVAGYKTRGYNTTNPLARRQVLQRALGECDMRLRAARALNVEILGDAWDAVCAGHPPEPPLQAQMRAVATHTTDVAADVATQAFRYSGGSALFNTHILQQCLRDINAAAQHQMVSDTAYENHGQFLLGLPDARVME